MTSYARPERGIGLAPGDLPAAGPPRRAKTRWAAVLWTTAAVAGLNIGSAQAQTPAAPVSLSSSARIARQEAFRALPVDQLGGELRARVVSVASQASIYRRLPVQVIDCDPDLFLFMVRHPEVIVNIWELMGISKVTMARTGPTTYEASDHAGSRGSVAYCYSDRDTQLVYAEGSYDGPLCARPIRASCVLLLKTGYTQEADTRVYVTCRMDAFIQIENAGVDLLAKTFQPLITKSADYNFSETAAFFSMVSRTAERNPRGMVRLSAKLTGIEADVRQEFAVVSSQTAQRVAERKAAGPNAAVGPVAAAQQQP